MNQTRVEAKGPLREDRIPWLENGDRLSRAEFERRYEAMPPHVRAQLIEGVVYLGGRVRATTHGCPHADMTCWLTSYRAYTAATESASGTTVRLDLDNEPQPDCLLYVRAGFGAQVRISADGFIEGPPELIAEVAATSASIELWAKKTAYRRNGVKEYIVWRVLDGEIDWFILRDSGYEFLTTDESGIMRSETFPGLWLDRSAMLRRDLAAVLSVLQLGLSSPDHARFVAELQARRRP